MRIALADPSVATPPAPERRREGNFMQTIGIVASGVAVAGVLFAAAVALKSIPDIRHYRRIRKM